MRLLGFLTTLVATGLASMPVSAQDGSASAAMSSSGTQFGASRDGGYEMGHDPFEMGIFGGAIWMKRREAKQPLTSRADPPEYNAVGGEGGLRLGVYPIPY